jgi:hypothetical protein
MLFDVVPGPIFGRAGLAVRTSGHLVTVRAERGCNKPPQSPGRVLGRAVEAKRLAFRVKAFESGWTAL